jgi:hypothetical protein
MSTQDITPAGVAKLPCRTALPALDLSQPLSRESRARIDKDSIYYSKEHYRLIPQRTGPLTIQYLVIDTYENELVGTHTKMSDAMAQRDALDPVSP